MILTPSKVKQIQKIIQRSPLVRAFDLNGWTNDGANSSMTFSYVQQKLNKIEMTQEIYNKIENTVVYIYTMKRGAHQPYDCKSRCDKKNWCEYAIVHDGRECKQINK